jgi:hypothetical protein
MTRTGYSDNACRTAQPSFNQLASLAAVRGAYASGKDLPHAIATLVAGCVVVKEAALQSHAALDATGIALGEFLQTSSSNPFGNARACGGFSDVEAMRQKTGPIHAPSNAVRSASHRGTISPTPGWDRASTSASRQRLRRARLSRPICISCPEIQVARNASRIAGDPFPRA